MFKKFAWASIIALIVLITDQSAKFLVITHFNLNESKPIINNVLHLTFISNTGSAFGLFKGFNAFFIAFSIIVVIVIFFLLNKVGEKEKLLQTSAGMLLGGTIGNLADRILHGAVIDFIDLRIWPVFNFADSAVTISVLLLIILLWKK